MPSPRRISYKYRSGAAALRSLSDGSAYFAAPHELNDALEAQFEPASSTQFVATLASTLTELAQHRGEALAFVPEESFAEEFAQHFNGEETQFKTACQQLGLFSSARRPNSQPMWAYYCGDSKGVCFELEWPDDLLAEYQLMPTEIHYSSEPRIHNRADDLRDALLALSKQHPDWSVDDLERYSYTAAFNQQWIARSMGRAVSVKHNDWQHEAELRMVAPRAGVLPILPRILKRIYYTRTDFPEWRPIIMLAHQLYPEVELAEVRFSHTAPLTSAVPMAKKLVPIQSINTSDLSKVLAPIQN